MKLIKKKKNQHYQCGICRNIELNNCLRCIKCEGPMFKYRDLIGIGVPKLVDGKVYFKD